MSLVRLASAAALAATSLVAVTARAQATADTTLTATPPAEAKALVEAPKSSAAAPKTESPTEATTATISAGGQLATGNSKLAAATVNGKFEMRRGSDGFAASLLGNYGESATPGNNLVLTAQNLQGRVRYDRYLIERLSLFLIDTERNDKFQGLDLRTNVDPGAKYLFVLTDATEVWGELGYDFQYDIRNSDSLDAVNGSGSPESTRTARSSAPAFPGRRQSSTRRRRRSRGDSSSV